jgi:hypothetical protein
MKCGLRLAACTRPGTGRLFWNILGLGGLVIEVKAPRTIICQGAGMVQQHSLSFVAGAPPLKALNK